MRKKLGFIICIFTIIQIMFINLNIVNATELNYENSEDTIEEVEITSRIGLIFDRASGKIIYEKNGDKQTPMASTTKIMTAIVVIENSNLNDIVTIDSKAASIGGSRLGLKKNDKVKVIDLLYGLMLRSGNDAALALASYVGGSVEGFAEMMNNKAQELDLTNTHFIVPHGLDNDGHYTTAYELAKITDYALENETFKTIVSTKSITISINNTSKTINNTNKLLGSVSGVYGVKTGFTNGAGRCLVTAYKTGDMDVIIVIIGADTNNIRISDTKKLIEYVKNNFVLVNIKEIIEERFEEWKKINIGRINVEKGNKKLTKLLLEELEFENIIIMKEYIDTIDISINILYYLEAPVKEAEVIGSAKVLINGTSIETLEIYNEYEVGKKKISDYLKEFINITQNIKLF